MSAPKQTWMAHAAHFCAGHLCQFTLATHVNGYIVSTIGEYAPHTVSLPGKWIGFRARKHIDPFETMGASPHLYESMVFKAKKGRNGCCPFVMKSGRELEAVRYMTSDQAYAGHMKLLKKWGSK